ncbi:MAG: histidine kinase dimerization/phospho-acceptor domain-containing protein, partial [Flavobacteriales bacterium]
MTGKNYHRLLERQLKKFLPGYPEIPEQWNDLFKAISNSYAHSDTDRLFMETAMRESSDELIARKETLNELFARQSHVLETLKEAAAVLFPDRKELATEDLLQLADLIEEEISKRKIAETKRAQSDQRLLDIIESLNLGMARYDLQGRLIQVERRFAEMFSMTSAEMVGMAAQDLPSLTNGQEESDDVRTIEFFLSNQVFESSFRCGKTGSEFWLLCTTAPLFDNVGNVEGGVIVVFDITSRKKLENEMQEARVAAEAGLELRKSILANVSHELRTPINAIVGMSSLLASTPLNDQQQEYLKNMRFSSDGLLVLIDDLLDVSRIESGKVELEEIEFSLQENFAELTRSLSMRAIDKGLTFEWHIDDRVAKRSMGDVHRLNQIINNLINNALKFTQKG